MALYEFYGETCPHCIEMMPAVDALIAEGYDIQKREVWNNQANADAFTSVNKSRCPGVPFFLNTETDQWICGATDAKTLKRWADGGEIEQ